MESIKTPLFFQFLFVLFLIAVVGCQGEEYSPSHQSRYAIYSILDPQESIQLTIWETIQVGQEAGQLTEKIIEIVENGNVVFTDTTSADYLDTGILPVAGFTYRIKARNLVNPLQDFESREILVFDEPGIVSYKTNDSVSKFSENSTQTLQQIEIVTDQSINDSPYYAYELFVDSLPNKDDKPYDLTSGWFKRPGFTCPEVGESPFLDRNLRIISLTCFEDENQFSIESRNHRPGDIDFVRFTLCNFDNHTMDFSRWVYQNGFFQFEGDILQILNTKDNFQGESGYDFVLNRTCKEFILDF